MSSDDGLAQALVNALPGRRAVLDHAGRIRVANHAWLDRSFLETATPLWLGVGDSLLDRFRERHGYAPGLAEAMADVSEAVQRVLAGDAASIELEIPGLDDPRRWERITVVGLEGGGALFSVDDITDIVLADRRNAQLATHDALTGLPNRALLRDRVEQALSRPARGMVAVLHIDLDRFSSLNASLGPRRADHVLVLVGERLRRAVGRGDTVARAGDDSFVVLTETSGGLPEILAVAEHLSDCVTDPIRSTQGELVLSVSVGVATARLGESTDELLRDAEMATREAKVAGGGRVVVARHDGHSATARRLELEQALRRAVERGELRLEYQPEVSLETGRVVGAEALLRWEHPTLGAPAPDEFIAVAEDTGLIRPVGEWVLRTACKEAAGWALPDDAADLYVAVNVSAHQLAEEGLAELVGAVLKETGLPPSRLCVEVTESAVVASWELASTTLEQVRALGVHVALDDVGAGYSSFSHLLRLPVDILKLDASLIARLDDAPQDRALVEGVVALARRLGLPVVAEGVEDPAKWATLARLGFQVVQGYGSGRPGTGADLVGAVWARTRRG